MFFQMNWAGGLVRRLLVCVDHRVYNAATVDVKRVVMARLVGSCFGPRRMRMILEAFVGPIFGPCRMFCLIDDTSSVIEFLFLFFQRGCSRV